MKIGKIVGVGIGTGTALTAGAFARRVQSYIVDYCVDDVYRNNPQQSGYTMRRVMCDDGSDMPHDIPVTVQNYNYAPSDDGRDYWE